MVGRSNGLRCLLTGIAGLWIAFGLSGCSVLSVVSKVDGDFDAPTASKQSASARSTGVSETFLKTYTAQKVKTLRVRDEMGAIEIKPIDEDRDEIRIEATKTLEGGDLSQAALKDLLSKVKIVAHLDGDALVVEAEHEKGDFPENVSANVAFVIAVPKRLALDLRTDNSPISATGSEGGVTLRTSNGAIELAQLTGTVDAETSNAPISLKETQAKESVKLVTSNGLINCEKIHAASPALNVTLETENAPVTYDGDATIATLHSSNGQVMFHPTEFALTKADLQTDNAQIMVIIPGDLSATVDAQTTNGHIYLDGTNDTDSDQTTRRIVLNGGKANVTAHTSNGSIIVENP